MQLSCGIKSILTYLFNYLLIYLLTKIRAFCQICKHLDVDVKWCSGYENLEDRKEVREAAWSKPGWDQCVSRTGKIGLFTLP